MISPLSNENLITLLMRLWKLFLNFLLKREKTICKIRYLINLDFENAQNIVCM